MSPSMIKLGLGLIGIGRTWGYAPSSLPQEDEVTRFLMAAYELNIDFFDTAPSYALSEERLGKFLRSLSQEQRSKITVATKFGEHWNTQTNAAQVDHSYDALCRSLDQSLFRLGSIDILQLHKTTPRVLESEDLRRAFEYARKSGINRFGASVSDRESGHIVCNSELFSIIQIPYNMANTAFEELIDLAKQNNKFVLINRPFGMGELLYKNTGQFADKKSLQTEAYRFILRKNFNGIILSGTKDIQHLVENIECFKRASKSTSL